MNLSILVGLLRKRRRFARRDRWSRAELAAHQQTALRALRAWTYERSRFYQSFHRGLFDRPLSELPVLTKPMLMERFDELVTDREVRLADARAHLASPNAARRFRDRYWIAATAGSTGAPGIFLHDQDEWTTVLASYARANDWAHIEAGLTHRLKLAVVSSRTPWHQSALVGSTLESRVVRTLRIDATDPPERILADLNAFQPESLVGYASMLRLLAQEQLGGRLRIAPYAVMSASEMLTPNARALVRDAWRVDPFDVYAATEPAGIASECDRHRGLHLFEDLVITEIVDEKNRPVPEGETGARVLVTVLFRRTQPLIRYEMSDRVALGGECDCGRPFALVRGVEGREEDVLRLRGEHAPIVIHPNVSHRVLEAAPVKAWQVVQEEEDRLRVLVAGASEDVARTIERALTDDLRARGALAEVEVERVDVMPRTALGKAPLVRAMRAKHQHP